MTEHETEIEGRLLAVRLTLAMILTKIADDADQPDLARNLHECLTGMIDSLAAPQGMAIDAVLRLHGATINELDAVFGIAGNLLKNRPPKPDSE